MKQFMAIFLSLFVCFLSSALDHSIAQNKTGFTNPVLAGFYPDPSICRVGSDYYLVNSTFAYYPGIPIFQSRDLVNWRLIGHVMDRPEQLNLTGLGVSRGIFAPSIRHHNGVFYVTCTLVDRGGNFVVSAKNPQGSWSNPVWLPEIDGIDPSLFFADNGKAYILYNSIAPKARPLYDGHRTIRMYEFDLEHLQVTGDEKILVNGGTDIAKKPVWIEAPHLFQKNNYFYLIAAEGGTGDQHSEVVFRSANIDGPYVPYEKNPILTQRHLNPARNFPITSTGHADFVQTEQGEWWAVFLGCRHYRPFAEGYYNTGRETFLAPVKWLNGWPVINPDFEEVQYFYPYPVKAAKETIAIPYSGNFISRDEFDSTELNHNWVFLRTPQDKWYDLKGKEGFLALQLQPATCAETGNPSFIGHRQQHAQGSVSIALDFAPVSENEKAGLLIFQNESHFYFLCQSKETDDLIVQLYKSGTAEDSDNLELLSSLKLPAAQNQQELFLKIEVHGDYYSFWFACDPDQWQLLQDKMAAEFLSTKVAGGFVGCIYAMYATSLGKSSKNVAYFDWFEYCGDDEIYKNIHQ